VQQGDRKVEEVFAGRPPSGIMLVCNDNDRGLKVEGRAYSQMLDPIGDFLASSSITVASSAATTATHLVGGLAHNNPEGFSRSEAIRLTFAQGGRLNTRSSLRLGSRVWMQRIVRHRVGTVIGIQPRMALCLAGKALGVPVYDLQHGQFAVPDPYYSRIAEPVQEDALPTAVLCWDEHSLAFASENFASGALLIGHPCLALGVPESAEHAHNVALASHLSALPGLAKIVLVLDTYTRKDRTAARDRLSYLREIRSVARDSPDTLWILRPHPVQTRSEWQVTRQSILELFGDLPNAFFFDDTGQPSLPTLLKIADGMVTRGSSGLIEASYFAIPTAIYFASRQVVESGFQSSYRQHLAYCEYDTNELRYWSSCLLRRQKDADIAVHELHRRHMLQFIDSLVAKALKKSQF
jgi:hypothetical protein